MLNQENKYNKPQFELVIINSVDIMVVSKNKDFEVDPDDFGNA